MKHILTSILLISAVILSSCNKDKVYPDIKEYDEQQIQSFISANGLTQMKRDTSGGDTTGMYYQILDQGTGDRVEYSDRLAMVFTIRSFDGKYTSTDTIINHFNGYLGQFSTLGLPKGLQSGIYNILKYKGGSMRLLIPSHLAYGITGTGSGSSSSTSRIGANQCLDYWVRIVDDQRAYDSLAIKNYAIRKSINLSEYTHSTSGLYYKISGLDTGKVIKAASSVTVTSTLRNLNNTLLQEFTSNTTYLLESAPTAAFKEATVLARPGQEVSLIIPSHLGYGQTASSSGVSTIPAFSCLRYDYKIKSVTNY